MLTRNTIVDYPILLMKAIGNWSFEALGRIVKKSGDSITRLLFDSKQNIKEMEELAQYFFAKDKVLYCAIDDTLLRKVHSKYIEGSGLFFDTSLRKRIMSLKLLVAAITNGKYTIPFSCSFLFTKELLKDSIQPKHAMVQGIILRAIELFPEKKIIVLADGAFATKQLLEWCLENKLNFQARMHSNRKVLYKGQLVLLRDIKSLRPRGRQMARTISVVWHGMSLFITAQRRIDKNSRESIVFQAATYQAKPIEHVRHYKIRWKIEKLFRTTKQHLGLQGCSARSLETQLNHVTAVLFAYSLLQVQMRRKKLKTPELALRAANRKKVDFLKRTFPSTFQRNLHVYA